MKSSLIDFLRGSSECRGPAIRDAQHLDLAHLFGRFGERHRIGGDDFLNLDSRCAPSPGRKARHECTRRNTCVAPSRISASAVFTSVPAVSMMSSTIRAAAAANVADQVHHFADVDIDAALIDDGQRRVQSSWRRSARAPRRPHRAKRPSSSELQPAEIFDQHRRTVQVIDRHVEIALNLRRVQIQSQRAACSGGFEQVGDQLR